MQDAIPSINIIDIAAITLIILGMKSNQKGLGAVVVIAAFLTVGIILGIAWLVATKNNSVPPATNQATDTDVMVSRDGLRKEHVIRLASSLTNQRLVQKRDVPFNQAGLDLLQKPGTADSVTDPLTRKPYLFNEDQLTMQPGEATFKLNATCDNKISGSNGTGLIIDAASGSVAVAIKLESGSFACESNI